MNEIIWIIKRILKLGINCLIMGQMIKLGIKRLNWGQTINFFLEVVIPKFIVFYTYFTCNFKKLLSILHVKKIFWDLEKISKSLKLEITCQQKRIHVKKSNIYVIYTNVLSYVIVI